MPLFCLVPRVRKAQSFDRKFNTHIRDKSSEVPSVYPGMCGIVREAKKKKIYKYVHNILRSTA